MEGSYAQKWDGNSVSPPYWAVVRCERGLELPVTAVNEPICLGPILNGKQASHDENVK